MKPTEKRQLIDQANEVYKNDAREIQELLNKESRRYWAEMTQAIKEELIGIIVGSKALTEENKNLLKDVIMNYESTEFEEYSEEVFTNIFMAQNRPDKLKKKLQEDYNNELENSILPICNKIKNSHAKSFNEWCSQLQKSIEENIEKYSPKLQELAKKIEEEDRKIEEVEEKQHQIERCAEDIQKMMEWSKEE